MTLICFASQKGSPGTSAAALAVAAAHRPGEGRSKLLLEADVSGGALAIRYRLPTEPGLVTLAAAARAGLTDEELWRHVCELPGGLPAILCPDGPEQVHSAVAAAGVVLGRHLANRRDIDVIADLGRLQPGSPAVEFAAEATALLMVARPTAEQLQPAAQRMLALRPRIKNLGWLLVGEKPHGPAEVESTFGFPVVGVLADDRRSVEAIEGGAVTRKVRRHPFVRSAATVASTLGTWLSPLAAPTSETDEAEQADGVGTAEPEPRRTNRGETGPRPAPESPPTPEAEPEPQPRLSAAPAPGPESEPAVEPEAGLRSSPGSEAAREPDPRLEAPSPASRTPPTLRSAVEAPVPNATDPDPATLASPSEESPPPVAVGPSHIPVQPLPEVVSAPETADGDHQIPPVPNASVRIAADDRAGRPSARVLGPAPPPLRSAPLTGPNSRNGHTNDSSPAMPSAADDSPGTEIDPPAMPTPPRPPVQAAAEEPEVAPDPFVHGDDDIEWTGT